MAVATQTMTDEQRKSVAIEYLKAFDNGGTTSTGGSILDLFADVGGTITQIVHHYLHFNWVFSGGDVVVCEGTSHGEHKDGPWRAGVPEWGAGQDTARYPWLGSTGA